MVTWSDFSLLFTRICHQGTNPCEQKWEIWPSTSTGTMVLCWSCKQSERERQNKQPTAFSVLIRFRSTHQNWFSPRNGREISSSLFDQTRLGQLYSNCISIVYDVYFHSHLHFYICICTSIVFVGCRLTMRSGQRPLGAVEAARTSFKLLQNNCQTANTVQQCKYKYDVTELIQIQCKYKYSEIVQIQIQWSSANTNTM